MHSPERYCPSGQAGVHAKLDELELELLCEEDELDELLWELDELLEEELTEELDELLYQLESHWLVPPPCSHKHPCIVVDPCKEIIPVGQLAHRSLRGSVTEQFLYSNSLDPHGGQSPFTVTDKPNTRNQKKHGRPVEMCMSGRFCARYGFEAQIYTYRSIPT